MLKTPLSQSIDYLFLLFKALHFFAELFSLCLLLGRLALILGLVFRYIVRDLQRFFAGSVTSACPARTQSFIRLSEVISPIALT